MCLCQSILSLSVSCVFVGCVFVSQLCQLCPCQSTVFKSQLCLCQYTLSLLVNHVFVSKPCLIWMPCHASRKVTTYKARVLMRSIQFYSMHKHVSCWPVSVTIMQIYNSHVPSIQSSHYTITSYKHPK